MENNKKTKYHPITSLASNLPWKMVDDGPKITEGEEKQTNINNEFEILVKNMKIKENICIKNILEKIQNCNNLVDKCILAREYLSPQSTNMEKIIKNDLEIQNPIDEISGDGNKNGKNYEIKVSVHAKFSKLNFVQIRPDHNIDYYIFVAYNMYEKNVTKGKAFIFKIPSINLYNLIVEYGGYAHGTCLKFGKITIDNLKGRNCEYALRCNPNSNNKTKDYSLWLELLKYKVSYSKNNF